MYGIKNCDAVKKARAWLDSRAIPYEFVDLKKRRRAQTRLRAGVTRLT